MQKGLESFPAPQLDGPELDLRLLVDHRERLVRHRVELNSTLLWQLHDLWPELQLPGGGLFSVRRLRELTQAINRLEQLVASDPDAHRLLGACEAPRDPRRPLMSARGGS